MTAATLNAHLESGGYVQVTTMTHSTLYAPKNAGWFFECGNDLRVKRGKGSVCLGTVKTPYVGIRLLRERVG